MRFAYADPPYPGLARRYYGTSEVNHEILIGTLVREFPHGWALSTSAAALPGVLAMCPPGVAVAAWIKGARSSLSWRPMNAWEPLIVYGGRPRRMCRINQVPDVLLWGGRQHGYPSQHTAIPPRLRKEQRASRASRV